MELFLKINNIDILLVTETHFTNKTYMKIPCYSIYHTEHPDGTAHGGTAVIIRNSIVHHELSKHEEHHLQATSVHVNKLPTPMTISSVYCPPRHNLTKNDFKTFFETLGNNFVCGGDFNSKHTHWGSRIITPKGRALYNLMQEENYQFLSAGESTYWPSDNNKIPDLLDLFITKGISSNFTDIESNFDLSSDHTPVIATISTTIIKRTPKPSLYNSKTNWDIFREKVEKNLQTDISLKTPLEIETATNLFTTTVQNAAWESTPKIEEGLRNVNIPSEILELVKVKRRARSKSHRTRNPIDRNTYNRLANTLKRKLKEVKQETYQNYLSQLSKADHTIWKINKKAKTTPNS